MSSLNRIAFTEVSYNFVAEWVSGSTTVPEIFAFSESSERNGTLRHCAVTQGRRQVYAVSEARIGICANGGSMVLMNTTGWGRPRQFEL
jgi:hypothetical protein